MPCSRAHAHSLTACARRIPTLRHGSLLSPGRRGAGNGKEVHVPLCEPARIARRLRRKPPNPNAASSHACVRRRERPTTTQACSIVSSSTGTVHRCTAPWLVFAHENVAIAPCSQGSSVRGSVGRPCRHMGAPCSSGSDDRRPCRASRRRVAIRQSRRCGLVAGAARGLELGD